MANAVLPRHWTSPINGRRAPGAVDQRLMLGHEHMFAPGSDRPGSGPPGNRTRISELKRLVRYRYASGPRAQHRSWKSGILPPWSSGLGRLPFTQEIAGSNPAGGTYLPTYLLPAAARCAPSAPSPAAESRRARTAEMRTRDAASAASDAPAAVRSTARRAARSHI